MLALKDYGSSGDDNSESENESENKKSEVNCIVDSINASTVNSIPAENLAASLNMQICSAPEVIPMVNIISFLSLIRIG